MNLKQIKTNIQRIIYALFTLVIALIFLRIFLIFIDQSGNSGVTSFFTSITNPFIAPFRNIYPQYFFGLKIENAAILAAFFYAITGFLFAKIATFFIEDHPGKIFLNLVDSLFKIFEYFLFFRFILVLTGGEFVNFGSVVNIFSFFVYEPFKGILPAIPLGTFGAIELTTLVALVVIIVLDIISENLIISIFNLRDVDEYKNYNYMQPQRENINVNVTVNKDEMRTNFQPNPNSTYNPNQYSQPQNQNDSFDPYQVDNY